ncbi:hypothetical protein KUCAC02_009238 [Chaenocephalus aceratus]|uniref:Uncharacterized protein n=1 Tax=Chaenocephalus aceratus TaxID=36190 RepID=A0ACB9WTT7_CHAAC|nr:hypothetical protein KUCAC02_009238 [Chaenocephalus aceratus]
MVKFATGEFGHLVLLAMFDCVDDTKLVKQAVLSEVLLSLDEVIGNKYGKKVLLYLLTPRDPAHLLPEIIKVLARGDGNTHSKKDMAVRRKELLEVVSPRCWSISTDSFTWPSTQQDTWMLKWLLEQDMTLAEAGKEERFSRILVDAVGTDKLKSWVKVNRGAMVLCSLLNSYEKSVAAEELRFLLENLNK